MQLSQPITQQVILLLLVNHFMPVTAISLTYLQLMIPLIKIYEFCEMQVTESKQKLIDLVS